MSSCTFKKPIAFQATTARLFKPALRLPPDLRAFHASPRSRIVGDLITYTQSGFESLHTFTGLPWIHVIPLSALIVRLSIVLPLKIRSRKALQRREDAKPIVFSWVNQTRKDTVRAAPHIGPIKAQKALMARFPQKALEIHKRHRAQIWRILIPSVVQLPIWFLMSESLRSMCGTKQGLLGLFASMSAKPEEAGNADIVPAANSHAQTQVVIGNKSTYETQKCNTIESLDHEGALWFTDLLEPDPYACLSALLSGLIISTVMSKSLIVVKDLPLWRIGLQRGLLLAGVAVFPLTMNVPAAMLIYWISSFSIGIAMDKGLDIWRPIRRARLPSKRNSHSQMPTISTSPIARIS